MNGYVRYQQKRAREREFNSMTKTSMATGLESLKELAERLNDELDALDNVQSTLSRESVDLTKEVRRYEIDLIKRALRRAGGVQTTAAKMLNLRPSTLNEKIKRFKLG